MKNQVVSDNQTAKIYTKRGIVLVDSEDLPKLEGYNTWNISKRGDVVCYHESSVNGKRIRKVYKLHRILLDAPENLVVDHKNHDATDNRKSNLRICTQVQNSYNLKLSKNNTSGYHGILWDKARKKWVPRIKVNYKSLFLGRYDKLEDAIEARRQAELKYFKEFAPWRAAQ